MDSLLALDEYWFSLLNGDWHSSLLDQVLPYWRNKKFWIPLYVLLAGILLYRYRWRGLYYLLAIGLLITLSDQLSSSVIKPAVERLRPCRTPDLADPVRTLVHCGGGYSFPSSHAANHFALSTFLFLGWGRRWGRWRWALLGWALSIAYAQVYVGVHFPLDAIGGAVLGTLLGVALAVLYRRWERIRIEDFYQDSAEVARV